MFALLAPCRGPKIDKNIDREIHIHSTIGMHPHIIHFHRAVLTPTHLCLIMEHAAGGELFDRINAAGRFLEPEARYFFQQLIAGVFHCHISGVCHRDLKLENTLLDDSTPPHIKICDFGYSKSSYLHSAPKTTVGTPAYIAPELLQQKLKADARLEQKQAYSGEAADVWSLGVILYVMLVGSYPFEDPSDPGNFHKTIRRIVQAKYVVPSFVQASPELIDLLQKIFAPDPSARCGRGRDRVRP